MAISRSEFMVRVEAVASAIAGKTGIDDYCRKITEIYENVVNDSGATGIVVSCDGKYINFDGIPVKKLSVDSVGRVVTTDIDCPSGYFNVVVSGAIIRIDPPSRAVTDTDMRHARNRFVSFLSGG